MDSYKILHVSEDASDEEIYKSYISLLSNYSSDYNTSPYARRKQREIEKAYQSIQNELKRSLYKEDVKSNECIINSKELFDYDLYRKDDIEDVYVPLPLKPIDGYQTIEASELDKKYDVVTLDVDYMYYVLGCKFSLTYKAKKKCSHGVSSKVVCSCCNSITKVNYLDNVVYCPNCDRTGFVYDHKCDFCNDTGYILEDVKEEVIIDDEVLETGIIKDNTLYKFNLINKERVIEEKNNISVYYDLSYEESLNGVHIKWDTKLGDIIIRSSVSDLKKEYVFDFDKKVKVIVNKVAYKGNDVHKYLFIKPSDLGRIIYLDVNTLKYNDTMLGKYNVNVVVNGENSVAVRGHGKEGINGGESGDLILTPIITSSHVDVDNVESYRIERKDTSALFNMFGGRFGDLFSFGFKGKNSTLIDEENKIIYVLSGNSKIKRRVSSYFLLSVFVYAIWILMPLMLVILPYTKVDLIISCVCTIVYSVIANIVLNLKV